MIALIRDLFRHQQWADRALLDAVAQHGPAAGDARLRELLHHIVTVQRFFLFTCQNRPFDRAREGTPPDTLDAIVRLFDATHALENEWLDAAGDASLQQTVSIAYFKDRSIPAWETLIQVCLHSQGHRSQCLTRLRELGGQAPTLDYILWTKDRPSPPTR